LNIVAFNVPVDGLKNNFVDETKGVDQEPEVALNASVG
jgi:hypothetical protein